MEKRASVWRREVDRTMLFLALSIICLNLIDAFCTLRHLRHGAEELNPLMDALVRCGDGWFIAGKHAIASTGIIGILTQQQLRLVRISLWGLLGVYTLLAAYQCILFTIIM